MGKDLYGVTIRLYTPEIIDIEVRLHYVQVQESDLTQKDTLDRQNLVVYEICLGVEISAYTGWGKQIS